jgi:4-amino-4-deoxy-L-arabinose transferase-like glycosyltransferase
LVENAATHGVFFQEFFLNQNLNRAMGVVDHKAGPWYYIPLILGGALPWSAFVLLLAPFWLRQTWRKIKTAPAEMTKRARAVTFAATFVIFTFLFFSALPTKLATYILPALPALALLAGCAIDQAVRAQQLQKLAANRPELAVKISASITLLVGLVAGYALALSLMKQPVGQVANSKFMITVASFIQATDSSTRSIAMGAMFVLAAGGLLVLALWRKQPAKAATALFAATVLATAVAVPSGILLAQQEKCRDFQILVRELTKQNLDAVMLGRRSPSAMFYLHKRVQFLSGEEKIAEFAREAPPKTCFLINQHAATILGDEGIPVNVLRTSGIWQIVQMK